MKLIANARRVAVRAHSMWANYLGILCLLLPEAIYAIWRIDTNPRIWWIAGVVLILYGLIGRLKDQGGIDRTRSPALVGLVAVIAIGMSPITQGAEAVTAASPVGVASEAEFAAVAVPLVAKWEGKRNRAYLDTIASPPVWTICFGETRGVRQGDYKTDAECRAMLRRGLLDYRNGLHRFFTDETTAHRLPATRDAAYVSLAWNVGIRGAGRSTATRRLNAGNIRGGCEALTWWTRAGGRIVRGLVRRRADEYRLCMVGIA